MSAPRAVPSERAAEWTARRERSNLPALRAMTWIALTFGRKASRALLGPIAAYFVVFAGAARRASRAYLRRALGRPPALADLYRHILTFATTVLDRVYLLNGRLELFDIAIQGEASLREALRSGSGAILMGAHLGSFEVVRAAGRHAGLEVAMLMYEENARKINAALAAINPAARQDVIPLGRMDSMLRACERLDQGAIVGVLGDRTLGGDTLSPVTILGSPAALPTGPMRMAAMLRRPVIFMAGLYLGGNRYVVRFEPIADFATTSAGERDAAVRTALRRYAELMERSCREAPYNWFNFYDFWRVAG